MDYKAKQNELMAKIKTACNHLDKAREEQDEKEWHEWYGIYTDLWAEYDKVRGRE